MSYGANVPKSHCPNVLMYQSHFGYKVSNITRMNQEASVNKERPQFPSQQAGTYVEVYSLCPTRGTIFASPVTGI